jgi:hypothetical protein
MLGEYGKQDDKEYEDREGDRLYKKAGGLWEHEATYRIYMYGIVSWLFAPNSSINME